MISWKLTLVLWQQMCSVRQWEFRFSTAVPNNESLLPLCVLQRGAVANRSQERCHSQSLLHLSHQQSRNGLYLHCLVSFHHSGLGAWVYSRQGLTAPESAGVPLLCNHCAGVYDVVWRWTVMKRLRSCLCGWQPTFWLQLLPVLELNLCNRPALFLTLPVSLVKSLFFKPKWLKIWYILQSVVHNLCLLYRYYLFLDCKIL